MTFPTRNSFQNFSIFSGCNQPLGSQNFSMRIPPQAYWQIFQEVHSEERKATALKRRDLTRKLSENTQNYHEHLKKIASAANQKS